MPRFTATRPAAGPTTARLRGARRFVVVFGVLGAAVAAFGGWKSWQALATGDWPRAAGTITASDVRAETSRTSSGTTRTWYPDIGYRYTVAGRTYDGHRVWLTARGGSLRSARAVAERYPVGRTVTVAYDPNDPARAVLEPGALGGAWIPLATGTLFLGVALWFRRLLASGLVTGARHAPPDGPPPASRARQPLMPTAPASRQFLWVFAGVWFALSLPFLIERTQPLRHGRADSDDLLMAAFALGAALLGPLSAVFGVRRLTRTAARRQHPPGPEDGVPADSGTMAGTPSPDPVPAPATRRGRSPREAPSRLPVLAVGLLLAAFVLLGGVDRVRGLLGGERDQAAAPPARQPGRSAPATTPQRAGRQAPGPAAPSSHGDTARPPTPAAHARRPATTAALPPGCSALIERTRALVAGNDAAAIDQALHDLLTCKIVRPEYTRWKRGRLTNDPQPFPEEASVQALRTRLAALRRPPAGAEVTTVPPAAVAPRIDGVINDGEWAGSLLLPIDDTGTRLRATSDGERLYLAADVPGERTAEGFDQLRVYLHVGLSPWLRHERAHLSPGGRIYTARISDVRFPGQPPAAGWPHDERWKRWRLDEGGVWPGTSGASTLDDHRRYELAIPLAEAGVTPGVPFTVAVEVETDPTYRTDPATGKRRFQHRNSLGRLGGGGDGPGVWWVVP